jgi:hypothetical protein
VADSLGVVATLKGEIIDIDPLQFTALTELFDLEMSVPKSTTDSAVPLTGIAAPKVLIVWGDEKITVKLNSEAVGRPADPLWVISKSDGFTVSALSVTNADTVDAHTVRILAAE